MTFEEWFTEHYNYQREYTVEYLIAQAAWSYQQNHIEKLEWDLTDVKNALKNRIAVSDKTIADLTEKLDIERNNKGVNKLNDECLFDTQEEHDRYELEQAIMSCWGITDDLKLLVDAMQEGEHKRMHDEMLTSIITLYQLKFENLFKEFNKFTGCY